MDVAKIEVDRLTAAELYRQYRDHRHFATPVDDEIRRAYREISRGKVVIQAIESIKRAGLGADGMPKLALAPAHQSAVFLEAGDDGSCVMMSEGWSRMRRGASAARIAFPKGSFPFRPRERRWTSVATGKVHTRVDWPTGRAALLDAGEDAPGSAGARRLPHPLGSRMGAGPAARSLPAPPHRASGPVAGRGGVGFDGCGAGRARHTRAARLTKNRPHPRRGRGGAPYGRSGQSGETRARPWHPVSIERTRESRP